MESLTQEQNKNSALFYTEDSSSESNTSEMSRHRDENSYYSRKQSKRSRTPEPGKEKHIKDFTTSPQLSPRVRKPVAHARSVPVLDVNDRACRTPPRVHDQSPLSRVSYEGSSPVEYQVRYVGGYRSGPEDDSEEPIRLLPYDRSPMHFRRGSEPLNIIEARLNEDYHQPSSSTPEHSTAYTHSSPKSRDERVEVPLNFSPSPTSSPHLRRKVLDIQFNPNSSHSAGSSPVFAQKQKKTAIVSPLLDIADSRPRSVPPGVFDPSDPESERVEQVSAPAKRYDLRTHSRSSVLMLTILENKKSKRIFTKGKYCSISCF